MMRLTFQHHYFLCRLRELDKKFLRITSFLEHKTHEYFRSTSDKIWGRTEFQILTPPSNKKPISLKFYENDNSKGIHFKKIISNYLNEVFYDKIIGAFSS